jgi:hypothetical protein
MKRLAFFHALPRMLKCSKRPTNPNSDILVRCGRFVNAGEEVKASDSS